MKLQMLSIWAGLCVCSGALAAGSCVPKVIFTDGDGDGVPVEQDCVDNDPTQYPGAPCTVDTLQGVCSSGTLTCQKQGGELKPVCESNAATPKPELEESQCNHLDDDCDGTVDEGCPCSQGDVVECGIGQGVCEIVLQICPSSGKVPECPATKPSPEKCNNVDDDCDGLIDDDNPEGGASCTVGGAQGVCANGSFHCENGALICKSDTAGTPEICNDIDDDCNGQVDEAFVEKGNACNDGNQGVCQGLGVFVCNDTHDGLECFVTSPGIMGSGEMCDGLDNDCNGSTDEGTVCEDCVPLPDILVHPLTLVNSDPEFDGNGPNVTVDVAISCAANSVNAEACVLMEETSSNWTVGYACYSISVPQAYTVSCDAAAISGYYHDTSTGNIDTIPGGSLQGTHTELVQSIDCIGDTSGQDVCAELSDCSQCTVHFNGCIKVQKLP